ncbi:hypothetical protein OAG91_01715 [bacterium]|nr:hypothetical protein [bacterium]
MGSGGAVARSTGILAIIAVGTVFGAILSAMFPRVFGFIFEMFLDIQNVAECSITLYEVLTLNPDLW